MTHLKKYWKIDLRNTSTILLLMNMIFYGPILQANVSDYDVELKN